MFYALYDFEKTKEEFMKEPRHYKLGFRSKLFLNNPLDECFNKFIFWRWIFYGIWQGALVLFVGFYSMEDIDGTTGRSGYYLTDG